MFFNIPGLVPETKVLESYYGGVEGESEEGGALAPPGVAPPVQKRTRYFG